MMIDAIIRVIDKIIELRRYQSDRLRRQYDLVVCPVMSELERVHANYLESFRDARRQLVTNASTLDEIIQRLETQSTSFEPVRRRWSGAYPAFRQAQLLSIMQEFVSALAVYLPQGDIISGTGGTSFTTLIEELKKLSSSSKYLDKLSLCRSGNVSSTDPCALPLTPTNVTPTPPSSAEALRCIDRFIGLQQSKWLRLCDAAARVQAAVAGAG